MKIDVYPTLTSKALKETFGTDDSTTRNALTILKLLERGEIYFSPEGVVHGMMVEELEVFGSDVGYPGELKRRIDGQRGLLMKLGGSSLTGYEPNIEEENNVVEQVNGMLEQLGWVALLVR